MNDKIIDPSNYEVWLTNDDGSEKIRIRVNKYSKLKFDDHIDKSLNTLVLHSKILGLESKWTNIFPPDAVEINDNSNNEHPKKEKPNEKNWSLSNENIIAITLSTTFAVLFGIGLIFLIKWLIKK